MTKCGVDTVGQRLQGELAFGEGVFGPLVAIKSRPRLVWSRARTGLSVFSWMIAMIQIGQGGLARPGRRVGAATQHLGSPAIKGRPVRFEGDGPRELLDGLVGLALLSRRHGRARHRATNGSFLELDGLLVVGRGLLELAALEPNQAAVDQEELMKVVVGLALESLERFLEIGLGFVELKLGRLFQGCLAPGLFLAKVLIPHAELAAGEAAQQIEPGEIAVGLDAVVQATISPLRSSAFECSRWPAGIWTRNDRACAAARRSKSWIASA